MSKNRNLDPLDAFPANQVDALNEFISTMVSGNFVIRIRAADQTVLEIPAGAGNDQVSIGINGKWRYITALVSQGGVSGAARNMDVFVTAADNIFVPGSPGEVDNTVYAFAIAIVESGASPVGPANSRKIAVAHWDGAKFDSVIPTIGIVSTGDPRLADQRVPTDRSVTPAKLAMTALDIMGSAIPQEGIIQGGSVTRLTANSIRIAPGEAWINGDGFVVSGPTGFDGRYRVTWPFTDILGIPAAPAGQTRLDQIVVQIAPDGHGVSVPFRRAGAASAGPTIANRTGAAAPQSGELLLWDVLVDATGVPAFAAANNRDRRPWARGAYRQIIRTAGNYSKNTIGIAEIDPVNLKTRIECSGAAIRARLIGGFAFSGAASGHIFQLWQDGVSIDQHDVSNADPGGSYPIPGEFEFTPAAGSHLFSVAWDPTVAGTMTIPAIPAAPLRFIVEEIVKANIDNGAS